MRIFKLPIKSMPIPGVSLKTLDLAFLSGYLGFDVTDRQQKTLARGMAYRSWVDAVDLMNALGGGVSRVDEKAIAPMSTEDRYNKHVMILSAFDRMTDEIEKVEPENKLSVLQEMLAEKWIEGAIMGAVLADYDTVDNAAREAIKYVQRKHPEKVSGKQHA